MEGHPEVLPTVFKKRYANESLEEHKVLLEIEDKLPQIKNSLKIAEYFHLRFSEMFNNAIEHSDSKSISVVVSVRETKFYCLP